MKSRLLPDARHLIALLTFLGLAVAVLAQSAADLASQAKAAYDKKEFAQSAKLYMQAHQTDPKEKLSLYNAACSFALAGESDDAFKALDELAAVGYNTPDFLGKDSDFKSIHDDPRWAKVVAKIEENAKRNPPPKPWKEPYQILGASPSDAAFASKLGPDNSAIWLDDDVLTMLRKSSAKLVHTNGGIQEDMKKIPGTDLWILKLKMAGWDRAIVSYAFIEDGKVSKFQLWEGSHGPALPAKAVTLQGQIIKRTIHSEALGQDRDIMVYLPPNAPKSGLPAVFMTDGGGEGFAAILESLILAHKVRPCAIVGIESGRYAGSRTDPYDMQKDFRALEYLPGADPERFKKHMKFFTDEVGDYVAKEFGISTRREDRAVTGFSNGGAFAAAVVFRRPAFFGTSMPMSLGVPPTDPKPAQPLPRMFFSGGALEVFGAHTQELFEKVKGWGVPCSFDLYVAGHDLAMWELAFSRLMPMAFPPK